MGLHYFRIGPEHRCHRHHYCTELQRESKLSPEQMQHAKRTSRWAEGNGGTNETDLQRALLCNHDVLRALAGVRSDAACRWAIREVGGAGDLDVVALFDDAFLLVDCKNSAPAMSGGLEDQQDQALRIAIAALSNITTEHALRGVHLVLLAGWRDLELPTLNGPLPGWLPAGSTTVRRVPAPTWWGLVPLALPDGSEHLVMGPWGELGAKLPRDLATSAKTSATEPVRILLGRELILQLRPGHMEAPLCGAIRIPAKVWGSAYVQQLREAAYASRLDDASWRFVGESNEKGNVRLWWECSTPNHEAMSSAKVLASRLSAAME